MIKILDSKKIKVLDLIKMQRACSFFVVLIIYFLNEPLKQQETIFIEQLQLFCSICFCRTAQVLLRKVRHVTQSCFYASPAGTSQTLELKRAFLRFNCDHSFSDTTKDAVYSSAANGRYNPTQCSFKGVCYPYHAHFYTH